MLVVDDRATTRQVIAARLQVDGHEVETAEDGVRALEHFKRSRWDVVITDRKMAGMSGEELAAAIKAINPATPVILVTGYAEQLTEGAFDMIVRKPFPHETLQAALTAVCPPA